MLNSSDKKDIRKIVKEEVESRTDPLRISLIKIEKDRKILKDIWEFVKDHTIKIKDHEERISQPETPSRF